MNKESYTGSRPTPLLSSLREGLDNDFPILVKAANEMGVIKSGAASRGAATGWAGLWRVLGNKTNKMNALRAWVRSNPMHAVGGAGALGMFMPRILSIPSQVAQAPYPAPYRGY